MARALDPGAGIPVVAGWVMAIAVGLAPLSVRGTAHEVGGAKLGMRLERFGSAVAVSGSRALVGVPNEGIATGSSTGAAYVFVRGGSGWLLEARLAPSISAEGDGFGAAVAIHGDRAVVGASQADTVRGMDAGRAFVFERVGGTWRETAALEPSTGGVSDTFGSAVAVEGSTILVGAPFADRGAIDTGAVFVFVRGDSGWTQQAILRHTGAIADDFFGNAVALSGDTALIGSFGDNLPPLINPGAAYAFVRDGSTWTQQQKLVPPERLAFDSFGSAVAINGDIAIVGAPDDDTVAGVDAGSAHVFVRTGTSWTREAELARSPASAQDRYGVSVAVSGTTALVGAPAGDGNAVDSGAAYVFVRSGSSWSQQARLASATGAQGDAYGFAVALAGETALVGAPNTDLPSAADAGAAFTHERSGTEWSGATPLDATQVARDYTGAWFDLAQSGHGLFVEHLPDDRIVASWYTFAPDGSQAWIIGVGALAGNSATLAMLKPANGRFPPGYDPAEVRYDAFGEMTLRFDDCDSGLVSFAFPAPYGTGTMTLSRPELPLGTVCAPASAVSVPASDAKASGPVAALTGSWAVPGQAGHGFQIEVLPGDRAVVAWYVFGADRAQLWLIGAGPVTGQVAQIDIVQPAGGRFIPDFDSSRITAQAVGRLTVTAIDCGEAEVTYTFVAPLGSGTLPITRVTQPRGVACAPVGVSDAR